jgi:hypothetical protein
LLEAGTLAADERSVAMLRLGATMSTGSSGTHLGAAVADALASGYSTDEHRGIACRARATHRHRPPVEDAPLVARALGYDVDAALEGLDPPTDRS